MATKKKTKAPEPGQFLVERTEKVKLTSIETYERNPRIGNVEIIAESLEAHGQFRPIVVQRATKQILAGNHTYLAAKKLGWESIQVAWVDVDDDMAKRIVLADNRTTDEGGYNDEVLGELLGEIVEANGDLVGLGFTDEETATLLEGIQDESYAPEPEGEELDDTPVVLPGVGSLKDEVIFPSDEPMGIPALDPAMIPTFKELGHIEGWAGQDMTEEVEADPDLWMYPCRDISTVGLPWEKTLICFYTDDDRFDDTWTSPADFTARLVNRGVPVAVEPDFSVWGDDPTAVMVWATYRARWCGRYWQEAGIKVIPNYGAPDGAEENPIAFAGMPDEPNCVAVGVAVAEAAAGGELSLLSNLNILVEEKNPKSLLIYGATEPDGVPELAVQASAFSGPYAVVEPVIWKRRRVRKEKHGVTDMTKL